MALMRTLADVDAELAALRAERDRLTQAVLPVFPRRPPMRVAMWIGSLLVAMLCVPIPAAHAGQNTLTWVDNSPNEQNFNIERKTEACAGGAAFVPLATVGLNIVTFTDLAVVEGATYCYRVNASNPGGTSAFSNTAARTVPFTVPLPPSSLTVN